MIRTPASKYELATELATLLDIFEKTRQWLVEANEKAAHFQHKHFTAKNELCKWLVPEDAKDGEQFNVWLGGDLFTVTYHAPIPATSVGDGGQMAPGLMAQYDIVMRNGGKVS